MCHIVANLATASCGDTAEEALENLKDAIEVHLDALTETGEIIQELRERNINVYLERATHDDPVGKNVHYVPT